MSKFGKKIVDISALEFCESLKLNVISFHHDDDLIVFDYSYTDDVYEVWALAYDIDLNLLGMGPES